MSIISSQGVILFKPFKSVGVEQFEVKLIPLLKKVAQYNLLYEFLAPAIQCELKQQKTVLQNDCRPLTLT